jgi:aryl-alcohol dehydrogenase-like predicted oxidoreductase
MLPLTGTSDPQHMKEDLDSRNLVLPPAAVQEIESHFA